MTNNEGKACDAVLRVLERRAGIRRSAVRLPEIERVGPPVELVCNLGDRKIALEHTRVEAFNDQIGSGIQFGRLIGPLEKEMGDTLPRPGVYYLTFPTTPHVGIRVREHHVIQQAIRRWVMLKAEEFVRGYPQR